MSIIKHKQKEYKSSRCKESRDGVGGNTFEEFDRKRIEVEKKERWRMEFG